MSKVIWILGIWAFVLVGWVIIFEIFGKVHDLSNLVFSIFVIAPLDLIIISIILFIYIKFYSLNLYREENSAWKWYFYLDYILLILALFFGMVEIEFFMMFALLLFTILPTLIIVGIVLLVKAYKLKPRLAYFFNLLIILLVEIFLGYFVFEILAHAE